jgi:hypothetical protein
VSDIQVKSNDKGKDAAETHTDIVADICSHISKRLDRGVSVDAYVSEDERTRIVCLLLKSKVPADVIKRTLPEQRVLLKHSHAVWTETVSFLKSHGFRPNQLLPLIAGTPSLLYGSSRKLLLDVMGSLRSFGIAEGKIQTVIAGNSQLLIGGDVKRMRQRQTSLLSVFTKAELQKLLTVTPCVLTDPWKETKRKIEYVYNSMGIRSRETTNSRLFSHTILHIVARHQFAERAGAYRMPNKHEIAAREDNRPLPTEIQNMTLRELIDSNDATFVRKIGDLSVDEYHAFVAMMAVEIEESSETDMSSDSESDGSDLSDDETQ